MQTLCQEVKLYICDVIIFNAIKSVIIYNPNSVQFNEIRKTIPLRGEDGRFDLRKILQNSEKNSAADTTR